MAKRIIPSLVRHFAEDASFQWIMRERAVRSPNHSREDIAGLDERLEAQLDALRVAGEAGWEICAEELGRKEPGEVFVAGVMAFASGEASRIGKVAEAAAEPDLPRALVSALGWLPWDEAKPLAESLSASETPVLRYAAVGAAAVHRERLPDLLAKALKDPHPLVLARALKACGELGLKELLPPVEAQRHSQDEACRFQAAWSSLLLGRADARADLFAWAEKPGPFRVKAMALALRAVPMAEALVWLDALDEADIRLHLLGLGWVGAAARAPWLVQQTRKPALARQAGAALTWITGVEFLSGRLGMLPPAGLEEELEEAGLAESTDADFNWPDPDKTEIWWKDTEKKFDASKAYGMGRPKSAAAFQDMLIEGKQCHRLGAALELALLQPGKPMMECRAPALRRKANVPS